MTNKLPPLPEAIVPASDMIENVDGVLGELFTRHQMREYGEQCRDAALEEAAKICDGQMFELSKPVKHLEDFNTGCISCIEAIRGLK